MAIQTDPQFKIRLSEALKSRLQEQADLNTRTLTMEIIHRLERSFLDPGRRHTVTLEFAGDSDLTLGKYQKLMEIIAAALPGDAYLDVLLRDVGTGEKTKINEPDDRTPGATLTGADVKAGMSKAFDEFAEQTEHPLKGKGPKPAKRRK